MLLNDTPEIKYLNNKIEGLVEAFMQQSEIIVELSRSIDKLNTAMSTLLREQMLQDIEKHEREHGN
jgi:hypothetical protein